MSDFWVSILQFSICLALGLIVFGISVCIVLVLVTENSLLRERITELETQLAESRRTVLAEVANYIERQSKDPKWSPSSDGELEHFASHLADDVRNDWMAEVEASAEREA